MDNCGKSRDGAIILYSEWQAIGKNGYELYVSINWNKIKSKSIIITECKVKFLDKVYGDYERMIPFDSDSWKSNKEGIAYLDTVTCENFYKKPAHPIVLSLDYKINEDPAVEYTGSFNQGKKSGNGTEYDKNGYETCKGEYKDGVLCTGTCKKSYWEVNILVILNHVNVMAREKWFIITGMSLKVHGTTGVSIQVHIDIVMANMQLIHPAVKPVIHGMNDLQEKQRSVGSVKKKKDVLRQREEQEKERRQCRLLTWQRRCCRIIRIIPGRGIVEDLMVAATVQQRSSSFNTEQWMFCDEYSDRRCYGYYESESVCTSRARQYMNSTHKALTSFWEGKSAEARPCIDKSFGSRSGRTASSKY
jgi:hypothetical protein